MESIFGKKSKPQTVPDFVNPWRDVDWDGKERLEDELTNIQLNHPELSHFKILLYGPVGAGKSCFINSVESIFHGEIKIKAYEQANSEKSCTKVNRTYSFTNKNNLTLPFLLSDVMGLEEEEGGGIHPEDIITALQGHIKDGYEFNPVSPLNGTKPEFIKEPTLKDRVHCVVSLVPANSISRMGNGILSKMHIVKTKAVSLDIPHMTVLTKVDDVCPLVNQDLTQIYRSRKIKERMINCSNSLGVPMKCIFPVSNYHEESNTNITKDVLILTALLQIVKHAKDYVKDHHVVSE